MMVSEAVSGGGDPDVQAEAEINSGSKWGQNMKGWIQYVGPRKPLSFMPFLF